MFEGLYYLAIHVDVLTHNATPVPWVRYTKPTHSRKCWKIVSIYPIYNQLHAVDVLNISRLTVIHLPSITPDTRPLQTKHIQEELVENKWYPDHILYFFRTSLDNILLSRNPLLYSGNMFLPVALELCPPLPPSIPPSTPDKKTTNHSSPYYLVIFWPTGL